MAPSFTKPGLARYWHKRKKVVDDLVATGELPAFIIGGTVRISAAAVEDYEKKHAVCPQLTCKRRREKEPADPPGWVDRY